MRLNVLLGAGFAAATIAATANADFAGVSLEFTGTATEPGAGFWAVRVYADFTSADDRLLSVIGADYASDGDQGLYHNVFTTGLEPNPLFFAVDPNLQWDSFVTIGHTTTVPGEPSTAFDPDGEWSPSGFTGGYFVPGDAPQGLAGFDLKVLVAQLTIENPNPTASITGSMTIAWEGASGGTQFTPVGFTTFPSPGVLALLALAGAAGSRRRG